MNVSVPVPVFESDMFPPAPPSATTPAKLWLELSLPNVIVAGVNLRVAAADAALSVSEKSFAQLTGEFADLTARRNQLQAALRGHEQRAERLQAELANIEAGLAATTGAKTSCPFRRCLTFTLTTTRIKKITTVRIARLATAIY